MKLTYRQSNILYELLINTNINEKDLSDTFKISIKTLQTDITLLANFLSKHKTKIIKNKNGLFTIQSPHPLTWWFKIIPQYIIYPQALIVKIYLLFEYDYITIQDIADNLYYTRVNIERVLSTAEFLHFPLKRKRSKGIKLSVTFQQRIELLHTLLKNNVKNYHLVTFTLSIFKQIPTIKIEDSDIQSIFDGLTKYILSSQLNYNDEEINNTFFYLVIFNFFSEKFEDALYEKKEDSIKLNYFLSFFNLNLCTRQKSILESLLTILEVDQKNDIKMQTSIEFIIESIIYKIKEDMKTKINLIPNIITQLKTHLYDLLNKYEYDDYTLSKVDSKLLHDFQIAYPLAFEAGKIAIDIFEQKILHNKKVNKMEIIYIGMYFQLLFNNLPKDKEIKIYTIIVSNFGIGLTHFIQKKIEEFFPDIVITETITFFQFRHQPEMFTSIDLVIIITDTPIPLRTQQQKHHVYLSNILSNQDLKLLEKTYNYLQYKKFLSNIVSPFIHVKKAYTSKKKLLYEIYNQLLKNDYVTKDFYQSLIERERLASTAFGTFALPHGNPNNVKKSTIVIMTLNKPIKWYTHKVSLVCMVVATQEDLIIYKKNISYFYQLLSNSTITDALINAETIEQIKLLITEGGF